MGDLLELHLEQLALRMGAFLRGFEDRTIHLGTPAQFAREFRKTLEVPLLRDPGTGARITYVQAVEACRRPAIELQATDPVSVLAQGIRVGTAADRPQFLWPILREDLAAVLRFPAMRFYIAVTDPGAFVAAIKDLEARGRYPVSLEAEEPVTEGRENFRPLPMVPAFLAVVSYEMLREAVALEMVESYHEEGVIRPIASDRGAA